MTTRTNPPANHNVAGAQAPATIGPSVGAAHERPPRKVGAAKVGKSVAIVPL
jgi:hypothetical protein